MPIAAVPTYLGSTFSTASPGQRFGAYLNIWNTDWSKPQSVDRSLWQAMTRLNDNDKKTLSSLLTRQQAAFAAAAPEDARLSLAAQAIAPFTTGLGNEHPLENGFAFLNPYGLPYLPGSGIKGVLRQAARELASGEWVEAQGWTEERIHQIKVGRDLVDLSPLDVLFGRESTNGDTQHVRGALSFWDAIPQIKGDSLAVDIMTPHQGHYYQQKQDSKAGNSSNPHDSGAPNPISFLTVPAGSGFTFHVCCNLAHLERLAPDLAHNGRWKALLQAAFEHAFEWLGFGAKTVVGYGAMREDPEAKKRLEEKKRQEQEHADREQKAKERKAEFEKLSPIDRDIGEFLDKRQDKNQPELSALLIGLKTGKWSGENKIAVAERAKKRMQEQKKWKEKTEKKNPDKDNDYQDTLKVQQWLNGG